MDVINPPSHLYWQTFMLPTDFNQISVKLRLYFSIDKRDPVFGTVDDVRVQGCE